ncbi:gem-associated protein 5 isoform X1 [Pimephales promelas]|uniref:gem-associated protein 5 isoform X1 n=1 Tax=Pimephales promelas TaxID=90988 RepID=UPI001955D1E5|nr:gem-associated protein 5 isoform X1 [Pimephales promelas]XP_039532926.1 gem-associated protein 5 isoform X1 [Pimephales promelas]KAG1969970.1 gem-associated protein [Pimephales promelas]KAG1969971.1 gem-associated protein [Pimephales promelas]KAG1969972.1 gem-associated protein [Pimephales promelas]
MHQRHLPASPNWYCSRCSDVNGKGVLGFGAKNTVYLLNVTAASPAVTGELSGHTERVSGFAFCSYDGQEHICASTSDDKTVKIWDSEQKMLLKEHNVHQSTITAVHWSPVQKLLLVTGDEKGIVVCYWVSSNDTQSFFPEPRTIFCVSCSPHEENYIAVGYKDGMIVVIDISRKGEVIHRLRGHDDEIHALAWCPRPSEEPLHGRSEENADGLSLATEGAEVGCYLASGSRDQTVRIWSTARGKGVMTLKLPFLKRRGAGVDPALKERLWLTVHWPKGRPSQIVSSCFGGEIVMWDLVKSGKQRWSLLGSSPDGENHSRIVFNMSSFRSGDRELLLSTSMDREIKCWDLASLECCWTLPTMGGFVYCLSFSPVGTGCLALGVGDSMIRVWNTMSIQNQYDIKTFWQGIKSKVTALAWHPQKEGSLAFGTDDGKVGIYEVYSNKPPQISSTYHRRTIYSLSWGPPVPPMSFGDKPSYSLYSCAGEGVIFQHDPWKLSGEASNIDKLIRDTNSIKHKIPPHTDLSWKPDGSVLAIGNEDGSIEVLQAPMLKLLCTVQQHHKIINSLRWHHEHSSQKELQYLLASGSSNATVYVHDLRSAIETPSENPVLVTEPFRTLSGHTNKITGLAWSPHHDGRLVTACYDGSAQVWDVLKEQPVCNYRGHSGRLMCVQWSAVHPDLVWTGGDDFTLQEWAVSKQEHITPPKSKKRFEIEKKRGPQKKPKKKKKASGKGGMKAEESELTLCEESKGAAGSGAEDGQSDNEEEEDNTDAPSVTGGSRESSVDMRGAERVQNGEKFIHAVKREVKEEKKREKPDLFLKKRKPRSILPLSTSMDHRPKEELQQDCLTLAAVRHSHGQSGACVPGSGDHIQLGLFTDRDGLYRMFQEEEESHVEAGHYDSMVYLRLWKGDVIGAINVAVEKGELTDHLLSLAPMAGYQVWARTVEAYVKQLCHQEQFLKAASHLVSIHKLYEAINLLKGHQFYREAIALARARLQPEDPVLKDLYMSWAAVLEKDGHYATAAKCYLATDSSFDAAKVIAKKGDVMSLKTAANVAWVSGESELAHSLSLRCAKDSMLSQDWAAAQEVLRTQDSLLGHRLMFCVNEILTQRLADTGVVTWTVASSHTWSKPSEETFLSAVLGVWQSECAVASVDLVKVKTLHQQLRAVDNPPATTRVPMKQLLSHISLDVTLCALSQLLCDWPSALEELLQALTRGSEVGHFTLMAEMCQLLLPQGLESVALYKQKLDPSDERSSTISQSVEAFFSYQLMYKKWWNCSVETSALTYNPISNGHRLTENNHSEDEADCNGEAPSEGTFSEGFWNVLLSEPHANLQATQRAIAEIQKRVASLIQQHSQCKETPVTPEEERGGSASGSSSESLSTLTAQVAEHHKVLTAIPELLRKYPFPDVMECCIVFLHMEKQSTLFPQHILAQATTLLRKYGSTEPLCKAWQRLTTST